MINKIKNIEDLRAERKRLQQKRFELEDSMRNDFVLIKESLNPLNIIKNGLGSFSDVGSLAGNALLGPSITMVINFLVSKVLFRKAGVVKKLVTTLLIRKFGVDFVEKNSDDIFKLVKNIITKFRGNKKSKEPFDIYDGGTVAEEY